MSYTNTDKLASVVSHWIRPMGESLADVVFKDKLQGINEWARRTFPVGQNYSIANEIGFLFQPTIDAMMIPSLKSMISKMGIADEDIPKWAHGILDELESKVNSEGQIVLMESFVFKADDIALLRDLVDKNLPIVETEKYEIIL